MSTESRLKKLRGSGGYIMANITDEQQRKGNLGGPDLFLAPIGRIESSKISKHYCNSCEKDYDGGPHIKYETPNEEVAENLILVEKGKYLCNVCGSTIAEYREFRKPDQASEVGKAKPISEEQFSKKSSSTQTNTSVKTETVSPRIKTETIQPTVQAHSKTMQPRPDIQADSSKTSNFSTIIGMDVYDESLKKIGAVREMGVDSTQSVVIIVTRSDGTEESISWNRIKKIGEIILLGSKNENVVERYPSKSDLKCPSCGFTNREGSKFCENCGTRI